MQKLIITLFFIVFSSGLAQIGGSQENIITIFSDHNPIINDQGLTIENLEVTFENRNDTLYSVFVRGLMTPTNTELSAALISELALADQSIYQRLLDFLNNGLARAANQGEQAVPIADLILTIEVFGNGDGPYESQYSLKPNQLDEVLFPKARHSKGASLEEAQYIVREFSDFQCPFCKTFALEHFDNLRLNLFDLETVRFEYHHFPLTSIHDNAVLAAEASECVAEVSGDTAFWSYHDALFEHQNDWSALATPNTFFSELSQELGFADIQGCLESGRYTEQILIDLEVASKGLGLRGTPALSVNGYPVSDPTSLGSYQRAMHLADSFVEAVPQQKFTNVTVQELAGLQDSNAIVLDVREQWEYDEAHIPGVVLIPLGELASRVNELKDDQPIYVVCRSGNRSQTASKILLEAGKLDINNVLGGTLAWQAAGFSVDKK